MGLITIGNLNFLIKINFLRFLLFILFLLNEKYFGVGILFLKKSLLR